MTSPEQTTRLKKVTDHPALALLGLLINILACGGTWLAIPLIQNSLNFDVQSPSGAQIEYSPEILFFVSDVLWVLFFVIGSVSIWALLPVGFNLLKNLFDWEWIQFIRSDIEKDRRFFLQFVTIVGIISLFVGTFVRVTFPGEKLIMVINSLEGEFVGLLWGLIVSTLMEFSYSDAHKNSARYIRMTMIFSSIAAIIGAFTGV